MPKSIILSNGNTLVGLDKFGQVYDFYFPHVGLENHLYHNSANRVGVWSDNAFHWLDDNTWNISFAPAGASMASDITAEHAAMKIKLHFRDVVYNESDIFIREAKIENLSEHPRLIKLFFNQQFTISETLRGNTAYFDPYHHALIHYKGKRVFLIDTDHEGKSFDDHSVGLLGIEDKEGTYRDAEDGYLQKNHIEHGLVDSVLSVHVNLDPHSTSTVHYWVCAAQSIAEAHELNDYVRSKTPAYLIDSTCKYWQGWTSSHQHKLTSLSPKVLDLFNTSTWLLRANVNENGTIIASTDSDLLKQGRDMYSYMWHRDAALVAQTLDKLGYSNVSRRFFESCTRTLSGQGYFMHKYLADESLGASWHGWVQDAKNILPIQEDETALVIYALWDHYVASKDLEFIEKIYNSFIKKAVQFLTTYYDAELNLPLPSFDQWERYYVVSCFTASSVYGALMSAARFAALLGKTDSQEAYEQQADKLKVAILKNFYDDEAGYFYKHVEIEDGKITNTDTRVDMSSAYAIYKFGVLEPEDPRLAKAMAVSKERLRVGHGADGIARHEQDNFYQVSSNVPGNPWLITTMWLAQYYASVAKTKSEFAEVEYWLEWAASRASGAGMLPEQIHPDTGGPLSATPLTWSHAEFVQTVLLYIEATDSAAANK
jgi:GH15 family glucan-1,4-alpha-glucosidase